MIGKRQKRQSKLKKYKLYIRKRALKTLQSLQAETKMRIKDAIGRLEKIPRHKGIRKLIGSDNLYRLRVGNYRIIYSIDDENLEIEILLINKRADVYR